MPIYFTFFAGVGVGVGSNYCERNCFPGFFLINFLLVYRKDIDWDLALIQPPTCLIPWGLLFLFRNWLSAACFHILEVYFCFPNKAVFTIVKKRERRYFYMLISESIFWKYLLELWVFTWHLYAFLCIGSYHLQIRYNFSFCFTIHIPFISFPCLITLAKISSTILNKSGHSGQLCLIHYFRGKACSFFPPI
jgi:hypothetical protein